MEEQGMGRRKRKLYAGLLASRAGKFRPGRTGLLLFFTLLFALPAGFAYADEGDALPDGEEETAPAQPEVRVESSPANPVVNRPWTVYIFVNHPNPQEVEVASPRFPLSISLERVRMETRLVNEDERWTRVEFLFTPLRADTISLEPFVVKTPAGVARVEGISARVREDAATARRYEPRFRWLNPAASLPAGEKARLVLELSNWEPDRNAPEGFFLGKAPENTVFEAGLPEASGGGSYRYPIGVIPLEEGSFTLDSFSFRSDVYTLTVPKLSVRVLPPGPAQSPAAVESAAQDTSPGPAAPERVPDPGNGGSGEVPRGEEAPFPESREKVFFPVQKEYEGIVAKVRSFWEEDRRVDALAEIRRNERDSFSGPFLVPLRREIERLMGFELMENERWRPLKIPLVLYLFFPVTILVSGALLLILYPRREGADPSRPGNGNGDVTFRRGRGFIRVVVLVLASGLALILIEESFGNFPFGRSSSSGNIALLRSTQGYMVPDLGGTPLDFFDDGQPVILNDYKGDWCLAETPDGRSGWVKREAVIIY